MRTNPELLAWLTAVAALLPDYTLDLSEDDGRWPRLIAPDGRTVHVSAGYGTKSGKANISGSWPQDAGRAMDPRDWGAIPYGESPPQITVSTTRDPQVSARDIRTRFLGRYEAIYAECLAKRAEREANRAARNAVVADVAAVLGPINRTHHNPTPDTHGGSIYGRGIYGDYTDTELKVRGLSAERMALLARALVQILDATPAAEA